MAGLDQRRVFGFFGGRDARYPLKEGADRYGVGGVVRALVDDLQHVRLADHAGGNLDAARPPAVGHRHFAAAERHLIARNRHRF